MVNNMQKHVVVVLLAFVPRVAGFGSIGEHSALASTCADDPPQVVIALAEARNVKNVTNCGDIAARGMCSYSGKHCCQSCQTADLALKTEGVKDVVDTVSGAFNDAGQWVGGAFDSLGRWIAKAASDFAAWSKEVFDSIKEFADAAVTWVGNAIKAIFDFLGELVELIITFFKFMACALTSGDFASAAWSIIKDTAGSAFDTFADLFTPQRVSAFLGENAQNGDVAVQTACQSFWLGIKAAKPGIAILAAVLQTFRDSCDEFKKYSPAILVQVGVEATHAVYGAAASLGVALDLDGHQMCFVAFCHSTGVSFPPDPDWEPAAMSISVTSHASNIPGVQPFSSVGFGGKIGGLGIEGSLTFEHDGSLLGGAWGEFRGFGMSIEFSNGIPKPFPEPSFEAFKGECRTPVCTTTNNRSPCRVNANIESKDSDNSNNCCGYSKNGGMKKPTDSSKLGEVTPAEKAAMPFKAPNGPYLALEWVMTPSQPGDSETVCGGMQADQSECQALAGKHGAWKGLVPGDVQAGGGRRRTMGSTYKQNGCIVEKDTLSGNDIVAGTDFYYNKRPKCTATGRRRRRSGSRWICEDDNAYRPVCLEGCPAGYQLVTDATLCQGAAAHLQTVETSTGYVSPTWKGSYNQAGWLKGCLLSGTGVYFNSHPTGSTPTSHKRICGPAHNPHSHSPHGHNPHRPHRPHRPHSHSPHGHNPHSHNPPSWCNGRRRFGRRLSEDKDKGGGRELWGWSYDDPCLP
jgi:hypothetical protein